MKEKISPTTEAAPPSRLGNHPLWILGLVGLLAWQTASTLTLFGQRPTQQILNEEPVLSGRHPLHMYHGCLGARALLHCGSLLCYDPAFHAGYPKTPIFDSGSRPAELLLAIGGGEFAPSLYKIGLALFSALVPWFFWVASRGMGLSRAGSLLACLLGLAVWWGRPCQEAFLAGELDILLAGLLVLMHAGMLIRYHDSPSVGAFLGILLTVFFGWLVHPILLALVAPLFFVYYVTVGVRHHLAWHFALWCGVLIAIAANLFWLVDWIDYWWIRIPLRLEGPALPYGPEPLWTAPLWGSLLDRIVSVALVALAFVGAGLLNYSDRRPAARLFGLGLVGFLVLSLTGLVWTPMGAMGTPRLLVPALFFAVPLAAHALIALMKASQYGLGRGGVLVSMVCLLLLSGFVVGRQQPFWLRAEKTPRAQFQVGLEKPQRELLEQIATHTTPEARILWEDRRTSGVVPHWTALLPLMTQRSYIGGLDPDAGIEHTVSGLCDQILANRPVQDWTDAELTEYCERYNIGWVVCWHPNTAARFEKWPLAEESADLTDGRAPGKLFTIRRSHSFALTGSADWLHADARGIVLGNVVPHRNRVVLSLHYQKGMKALPTRVRIEPELDPRDPIPLIRLVTDEPVSRVTLIWSNR